VIIPIGTDYRHTRRPWMNYALVAANVLLFVWGINGTEAARLRIDAWLLHPENPQLHQFFSSAFLHGSWMHLLGNMIFLWVFGNAINDRLGQAGYLAFYLAGGVAASIGYVLFSGEAPVLGASGAISAVTGAYLVLFPRARVTVLVFLFILLVPFEVSSLFFLLLQFLFNVVSVYTEMEGRGAGVAWFAHISGYLFGFAVAAGLLATRVLPRDPFDLLNLFRAGRRRFAYRQMVGKGYDPYGYGRLSAEAHSRRIASRTIETATPDTQVAREMQLRQEIGDACARHDLAGAAEAYLRLMAEAPGVVLSRTQQLDVANQLMATDRYVQAAQAYEKFLQHYRTSEYAGDVYLMLGLLYGRYLQEHDRSRAALEMAMRLLRDPRKIDLARSELESLGPKA
jgi:membrane associated rhomboid family serine protease